MKKTLITIALTTVVVLTLLGIAVFAVFGSFGMGGAASPVMDSYSSNRSFAAPAIAPAAPAPAESFAPAAGGVSDQSTASGTAPLTDVERKIIKNANLSLVLKDPLKSMDDITALAEQLGGYVVSSNVYQSNYGPNNIAVPEGNISIRIPADKLNDILDQIKKGAVEVQSENVSGQDVTDQYVDLQSRLSAKQAAETKLLQIMDQAVKTEDVLAVYTQLQQVQSDIEVLKGQIKFIDQSAALSSVTVTLIAEAGTQPIEIGGWKLQGTANESVQQLIQFTQGFVQFLIRFFLNYLWRIILIGLPLYGLFVGGRAVYRRLRKSKPAAEVKEEKK